MNLKTSSIIIIFSWITLAFTVNNQKVNDESYVVIQQFDTITNWQVRNGNDLLFAGNINSEKSTLPINYINYNDITNLIITFNNCTRTQGEKLRIEICSFSDKEGWMKFDERKTLLTKDFEVSNSNSYSIDHCELKKIKKGTRITFIMYYRDTHLYLGQLYLK